jgi:hypothetical protein
MNDGEGKRANSQSHEKARQDIGAVTTQLDVQLDTYVASDKLDSIPRNKLVEPPTATEAIESAS